MKPPKISIEGKPLFKKSLPAEYQNGFAKDINSCAKGLRICNFLIVRI